MNDELQADVFALKAELNKLSGRRGRSTSPD